MVIKNIKNNLKSGLTVSFISLPLAISLAVASGATPVIGIITAIWAGLIAAMFGGSNFNVVGPTGVLSGLVATYVFSQGISGLPMLTVMVGIFIIIASLMKLERYLILIPSSVIHGFTLGIAFILGLGQINSAFGLHNLISKETFFDNLIESIKHLPDISWITLGVFVIFLVGLIYFRKITTKIPGAIILAPLGILLGYLNQIGIIYLPLQTLGEKFGNINFKIFQMPHLAFSVSMIEVAAVIAFIAILETMLSARIADNMTHTKFNQKKEVIGLGLANIISGLMGGMPATAALARTSLNIKAGGTNRGSAIVSALGIALISFIFLGYFKYIPLVAIAAILVFIAIQMVEKERYEKLWHYDRIGFLVSIFVAGVTVVFSPIIGILLGVSISLLIFVNRISRGHYDLKVDNFKEGIADPISGVKLKEVKKDVKADVLIYSFKGKLCYINSRAHIERFESSLKKYKYIILRLREVYFIDTDGIEALDEIIDTIESRGQEVILTGIDQNALDLLEQLSHGYKKLKEKKLIFKKSEQALSFIGIKPEIKEKNIKK